MEIVMKNGQRSRFQIAKGTYLTPKQLEAGLYSGVIKKLTKDFEKRRHIDKTGAERAAQTNSERGGSNALATTPVENDNDNNFHPTSPPPNKRAKKDVEIEFNQISAEQSTDEWEEEPDDPMAQKQEKGSLFRSHPDLYEKWEENKKSWSVMMDLIEEKFRREALKHKLDMEKMSQIIQNRDRLRLASEFVDVRSDKYAELAQNVDNEEEFYRILGDNIVPMYTWRDNGPGTNGRKIDANLEALILLAKNVQFEYQEDLGRFELRIADDNVQHVELSSQIAYVLGYPADEPIRAGDIAKYACDLKGGVSHLCVYISNNMIENMIVGDTLTSLLQIVAVSGSPGDVVEKRFPSPVYNRIIAKEIEEISVEIRSLSNRPIPFDYGTVILTLVFKKIINF